MRSLNEQNTERAVILDSIADGNPYPFVAHGGPFAAASYEIVPLDFNTAQWLGHWGIIGVFTSNGPPGPAWRRAWPTNGGANPRMFTEPRRWHNQYIKMGQEGFVPIQ